MGLKDRLLGVAGIEKQEQAPAGDDALPQATVESILTGYNYVRRMIERGAEDMQTGKGDDRVKKVCTPEAAQAIISKIKNANDNGVRWEAPPSGVRSEVTIEKPTWKQVGNRRELTGVRLREEFRDESQLVGSDGTTVSAQGAARIHFVDLVINKRTDYRLAHVHCVTDRVPELVS